MMLLPFRARDWDYLGWRYSLLSSIAVAGWNNVLDMIPARDPEECRPSPPPTGEWFRGWIDWTATNKEYLRHTRTILGQPAIGQGGRHVGDRRRPRLHVPVQPERPAAQRRVPARRHRSGSRRAAASPCARSTLSQEG